LDWSILHGLNGALVGRDWLEDPVTVGSSLAVPAFAAATVGLWLLAKPHGDLLWKRACLSALVSATLALAVNQLVARLIWERPRPFAAHPDDVHLFAGGSLDPSFPSDHAAAAFAIAVAVALCRRRGGMVFLAAAALISVSRVVEGLHYPSDIVAGAAVGAFCAVTVTVVARPAIERVTAAMSVVTDPIVIRLRAVARR
jgi:undecaprenyl-diphosphatase